ncbi:hypothetical protein [Ensifer sp. ENS03]|uniref:hypothetical protein n=1 Tax=Ensifer sp. ENS03 TaxID=2769283 RepID=UPI00177D18FD|nr:hypothetical protein [Ensifer sp. ENS03]MBD9559595.1 hypothetical protein [Ensifer sp. ENS03]
MGAALRPGPRKKIETVLVLSQHPNPSFSYYLEKRLGALRSVRVVIRSINDGAPSDIEPDGLFVVVCRYVRPEQIRWLRGNIDRLSGISLFLDDDMAAIVTSPDVSVRYKFKLLLFGIFPLLRLNPLLDFVWASTEPLATSLKTRSSNVFLLPPAPDEEIVSFKQARPLTMAYHATGVHVVEHKFLVPIVEAAMARHGDLHFEVVASGRNAAVWRRARIDARRLHILPELTWADYLHYCGMFKVDIALVPLLPNQANACRADTKRIDVCRSGAAAIFSETEVFDRNRQHGEIHVKNTFECWIAAIDELVASSEKRRTAAVATRCSLQQMVARSSLTLPGLSPLSREPTK